MCASTAPTWRLDVALTRIGYLLPIQSNRVAFSHWVGSTYASGHYRQLLKENQMLCSMSRKGECHDNAVAESFFGTLKTELVDDDYRTRQEARQSLFEYIEVFYNRQRRHSYLGYVSPTEYEGASALN